MHLSNHSVAVLVHAQAFTVECKYVERYKNKVLVYKVTINLVKVWVASVEQYLKQHN